LRPPGSAKTLDIQYDGENNDRFTAGKLLIAEVMNENIMARTAPETRQDLDPVPARRAVSGPVAPGAGSARQRSGG
jgi:hypothetical protein